MKAALGLRFTLGAAFLATFFAAAFLGAAFFAAAFLGAAFFAAAFLGAAFLAEAFLAGAFFFAFVANFFRFLVNNMMQINEHILYILPMRKRSYLQSVKYFIAALQYKPHNKN